MQGRAHSARTYRIHRSRADAQMHWTRVALPGLWQSFALTLLCVSAASATKRHGAVPGVLQELNSLVHAFDVVAPCVFQEDVAAPATNERVDPADAGRKEGTVGECGEAWRQQVLQLAHAASTAVTELRQQQETQDTVPFETYAHAVDLVQQAADKLRAWLAAVGPPPSSGREGPISAASHLVGDLQLAQDVLVDAQERLKDAGVYFVHGARATALREVQAALQEVQDAERYVQTSSPSSPPAAAAPCPPDATCTHPPDPHALASRMIAVMHSATPALTAWANRLHNMAAYMPVPMPPQPEACAATPTATPTDHMGHVPAQCHGVPAGDASRYDQAVKLVGRLEEAVQQLEKHEHPTTGGGGQAGTAAVEACGTTATAFNKAYAYLEQWQECAAQTYSLAAAGRPGLGGSAGDGGSSGLDACSAAVLLAQQSAQAVTEQQTHSHPTSAAGTAAKPATETCTSANAPSSSMISSARAWVGHMGARVHSWVSAAAHELALVLDRVTAAATKLMPSLLGVRAALGPDEARTVTAGNVQPLQRTATQDGEGHMAHGTGHVTGSEGGLVASRGGLDQRARVEAAEALHHVKQAGGLAVEAGAEAVEGVVLGGLAATHATQHVLQQAQHGAITAAESVGHAVVQGQHAVQQGLQQGVAQAAEAVRHAQHQGQQVLAGAGQVVVEGMHQVQHVVVDGVHQVQHVVEEAGHVTDAARQAARRAAQQTAERVAHTTEAVANQAVQAGQHAAHAATQTAHAAAHAAHKVVHQGEQLASHAGHAVSHAAVEAVHAVEGAARQALQTGQHAAQAAAHAAQQGKEVAANAVHAASHAAAQAAERTADAFKHAVHEAQHAAKAAPHVAQHGVQHAAEVAGDKARHAAATAGHAAEHATAAAADQLHAVGHVVHQQVIQGAEKAAGMAQHAAQAATQQVVQGAEKAADMAQHAAQAAAQQAGHAAHVIRDVAHETQHAARAGAQQAAHAIHDVAHGVLEQGQGVAADMAHSLKDKAHAAGEGLQHAAHVAERMAHEGRREAEQMAHVAQHVAVCAEQSGASFMHRLAGKVQCTAHHAAAAAMAVAAAASNKAQQLLHLSRAGLAALGHQAQTAWLSLVGDSVSTQATLGQLRQHGGGAGLTGLSNDSCWLAQHELQRLGGAEAVQEPSNATTKQAGTAPGMAAPSTGQAAGPEGMAMPASAAGRAPGAGTAPDAGTARPGGTGTTPGAAPAGAEEEVISLDAALADVALAGSCGTMGALAELHECVRVTVRQQLVKELPGAVEVLDLWPLPGVGSPAAEEGAAAAPSGPSATAVTALPYPAPTHEWPTRVLNWIRTAVGLTTVPLPTQPPPPHAASIQHPEQPSVIMWLPPAVQILLGVCPRSVVRPGRPMSVPEAAQRAQAAAERAQQNALVSGPQEHQQQQEQGAGAGQGSQQEKGGARPDPNAQLHEQTARLVAAARLHLSLHGFVPSVCEMGNCRLPTPEPIHPPDTTTSSSHPHAEVQQLLTIVAEKADRVRHQFAQLASREALDAAVTGAREAVSSAITGARDVVAQVAAPVAQMAAPVLHHVAAGAGGA